MRPVNLLVFFQLRLPPARRRPARMMRGCFMRARVRVCDGLQLIVNERTLDYEWMIV